MNTFGKIGEYVQESHFFPANGIIDDDKKRAILLSSCGSRTYSLFRSLVAPKNQVKKLTESLLRL